MEISHLLSARELLVEDSGGWCQKSDLVTLVSRLPTPYVTSPGPKDRIVLAIRYITQSEWNMLTCVQRLEWMRIAAETNEHLTSNWFNYASADIEYWHVSFRSLLDYVALVLLLLAGRQADKPSFHKLYERCTSGEEKKRESVLNGIGPESVKLIQNATWFNQILRVRTSIVHRGGHTLVFSGPADGILFQVYGGFQQNLIASKPWMLNKNVARFDRYAAHLMSHLIIFLEEFASIAAKRLEMLPLPECDARICHDGFTVLRAWIKSALGDAV